MTDNGKSKASADKKGPCAAEDLLVMFVAYNGGAGPGYKAYKFFNAVDEGGHSVSSFEHQFRNIATKAKELLEANPEAQEMIAGIVTPKKTVAKKRKAGEGEGAEKGGDGVGADDDTPSKKKKTVAKGKGKAGKGAEEGMIKTEEGATDYAAMGYTQATE